MKTGADIIELVLPARAEYVGVARLTISGVANRIGMSYDDIEDVKLAVAEACTNAVQHAYSGGEAGNIYLQCEVCKEYMQIVVADKGRRVDVNRLKKKLGPIDKNIAIEDMAEGGLGLYLIHTLMDEVQMSGEEGVVISMIKYLQRDEVANHVGKSSKQAN